MGIVDRLEKGMRLAADAIIMQTKNSLLHQEK
jgi:hypothetical protein